MPSKKIILSSAGLKNVNPGKNSDDKFEFIFGDHKMKMNNIFADFISPAVSKIHASDPIINNIDFTDRINGITITEDILSILQSLSRGFSVEVRDDQAIQIQSLSILLDNQELFLLINDKFDTNISETNIDQYLTYLTFFYQISPTCSFINYSDIIKYIASHFHSIDQNKILRLPLDIVYSIISNEYLVIETEDSLFEFIAKLFREKEDKYEIISFWEEIDFTMLSESKFNEFIEKFPGSEMTAVLWQKLRKCFYTFMKSQPNVNNNNNENRYAFKLNTIEYDGNESHRFDGIISYLTQKSGGNVSDNGTVNVTSSSSNSSNYIPKNAVDVKNSQSYFQSGSYANSWLRYDFIQNKVCPACYSIRTRHDYDGYHPRSWAIEGSNTGGENESEWTVLDSHTNDSSLQGKNCSHTFNIKNWQSHKKGFRYLRMRETGTDSNGAYCLTLSALEYFGLLIEK